MASNAGARPTNRRGALARLAYERIKDDILDQRLLPKQQLVETELANRYGMSKTPIREALATLAREGLVELSSFRGGRVRDFTTEQAREVYEVRELLEPFALERAVPRMDDGDRRLLRSLLREAREAAESGNRRKLARVNRAFHAALVARCGNSWVVEILDRSQDQVRAMSLRLWNAQATYLHESDQHKAVLEAVEAGDAKRAARLLRRHITEFKERYIREWEE